MLNNKIRAFAGQMAGGAADGVVAATGSTGGTRVEAVAVIAVGDGDSNGGNLITRGGRFVRRRLADDGCDAASSHAPFLRRRRVNDCHDATRPFITLVYPHDVARLQRRQVARAAVMILCLSRSRVRSCRLKNSRTLILAGARCSAIIQQRYLKIRPARPAF